ncbi:unnamed protein product [Linum tenue]|uniref:AB hydrolase-1 domain-containing protein n=1 Tax=Linum tenue TaxID=586396 RepID=A0AAV0R9K8_9ROSI|nr:unnamed protein product [Linum tenue]
MEGKKQSRHHHFVLVHGACHGAWCWYKVVPLLTQAGYKVTALDLAACGIHPKQVTELGSVSDYLAPLMELMTSLTGEEEKVILVGHSMGCVGISAAMEKFAEKVAGAVFVAAMMPAPHPVTLNYTENFMQCLKQMDFMDSQFSFHDGPENPPTSVLFGPKAMSTKLYQLSPPEDLTLGMMLIRPCPLFNDAETEAEIALTSEKYGSVPRAYVVCEADEIIKPDLQRWMIENNPTDMSNPYLLLITWQCSQNHMSSALTFWSLPASMLDE